AWGRPPAERGWPWPPPRLSYANAAIAEAVIVAGTKLGRDQLLRNGLRMLGWLAAREARHGPPSADPARGRGGPAVVAGPWARRGAGAGARAAPPSTSTRSRWPRSRAPARGRRRSP